MLRKIKNSKLKKGLEELGLGAIDLYKNDGYFFVESDDDTWADRISSLYTNSILINSFKDQDINNWVSDIVNVLCGTYVLGYPRRLEFDWQIDLMNEAAAQAKVF